MTRQNPSAYRERRAIPILGPVPCKGCGRSVYWGRSQGQRGKNRVTWRNASNNREHGCRGLA